MRPSANPKPTPSSSSFFPSMIYFVVALCRVWDIIPLCFFPGMIILEGTNYGISKFVQDREKLCLYYYTISMSLCGQNIDWGKGNLASTLGAMPWSDATSSILGHRVMNTITTACYEKLIHTPNVLLYLGNHITYRQLSVPHYHIWFVPFMANNCMPNST